MDNIFFYITVFIFGSVIGSFLNVCIYRIPRGLSIITPSSRCPLCNAAIKPFDNIPVLSWIILRGRCRKCKSPISIRYPLVELMNAVLYTALLWKFGGALSLSLCIYFLFISSLIVITFIDVSHQIIPNGITLPGIILSIFFGSVFLPDPFSRADALGFAASVKGVLLGGVVFYAIAVLGTAIFKKQAMGGGDIKLMAMVGGITGWKGVLLTTFIGSLAGSVIGIFLILVKGRAWSSKIPFGPYLAFGSAVSLFLGQEILTWYLYAR